MSKIKKSIIILISIFVLFQLSLFCIVNDYKIWINYGNVDSGIGNIMDVLGELVAPLIFIASGIILAIYFNHDNNYKDDKNKNVKSIISLALSAIAFGYSFITLMKMDNIWITIIGTAIIALFIVLFVKLISKIEPGRLFQLYCIAITAMIYCIAVLVVVSLIKVFWGRIRPYDLKAFEDFSQWYLPQGITGNRSFPSGHTTNASTLIIITMFVPLVKNKIAKIALYVVPAIWIVFMAYSRVIIGAHYVSDTLFAVAISISIFLLTKKYTLQYIEKKLG